MAKMKTTDDLSRAYHIVHQALFFNNATKEELAYLKKLWNSNREFRDWFESNTGNFVTLSSGRVRDAKDAYSTFGFTPLQKAKDEGPGTNRLIARSGLRTNQTGAFQDAKIYTNGKSQVAGGRVRTSGETAAVIKRGLAGGKLSDEDQRIFDRWQTIQRETEQNRQLASAQQAAAKQAKAQREYERAEKLSVLGIGDGRGYTDSQIADMIARRDATFKTNEEIRKAREIEAIKAKAKADEEAAIEAKWRSDNNIDPDDVVSDYQRKLIKDGYKAWGYRPEDQRAIDDLEARLAEIYRGTSASEEDRANLSNQLEAYKARVRKGLIDKPNGQNAEQMLASAYRDANGVLWGKNSKGDLVKLDEPKPEKPVVEKPTGVASLTFKDYASLVPSTRKEIVTDDGGNKVQMEVSVSPEERIAKMKELWEAERGNRFMKGAGVDPATFNQPPLVNDGVPMCPVCGAPLGEDGACPNGDYDIHNDGGEGEIVEADTETPIIAPQPSAQPQGHIKSSYL